MAIHIYVDADACPVKDEAVRVAVRYSLPLTFVSNQRMRPIVSVPRTTSTLPLLCIYFILSRSGTAP